MFTRDFWRALAIRTGVIYVQAALALFVLVPDMPPNLMASNTARVAVLAAVFVGVDQRFTLSRIGWRYLNRTSAPVLATAFAMATAVPWPTWGALVGAVAVMSFVNPLHDTWVTPPRPIRAPAVELVIGQRRALAERALREPQVRNAGLSADEKAALRTEIEEAIEREAATIAIATTAQRGKFQRAREEYRSFEALVVLVSPFLRWTSVLIGCMAVAVLLVARIPAVQSWVPAASVLLSAIAVGLAVLRRAGAKHVAAAGVAALVVAWVLPPDVRWPLLSAVFALLAAVAWVGWKALQPIRMRDEQLRQNDPSAWPSGDRSQNRVRAEAAYEEWVQAMFEVAVLRITGTNLAKYVQTSYDTTLPPASVEKLGDITELTQFVPTETSERLNRMMQTMPSGTIGVSGPRGVGKSTVLRVLSDFRANDDDLGLIVPAPTSYDAREFLTHLFARLCSEVLSDEPRAKPRLYRRYTRVVFVAGVAVNLVATFWAQVLVGVTWVRGHVQDLVMAAGLATAVVGAVWTLRRRSALESPVTELARRHLRTLRYLETQTVTRTGAAKMPFGDLGGSRARQRAEVVRTFPELVDDFRTFLEQVGLSLRTKDARVVICIDELDKIGTAEQAEKFLNDIKAIFRVRHSFFLVSVSEDALTSFSRRALTVRTTFDTAFDAVVEVGRFSLADTRALLVQQVIRMPEPFVWFCHCLSGGLPRDLGRIVRTLYDVRDVSSLPDLAAELVRQDVRTVAQGQLAQVSGRADVGEVLGWTADVLDLPMVSAELVDHCGKSPDVADPDLAFLVAQCCAHLRYSATLLEVFRERLGESVSRFQVSDAPVSSLAKARSLLSVDPGLAERAVAEFRSLLV